MGREIDLTKRTFKEMRENDYISPHLNALVRHPRLPSWIVSSSAATCVLGTLLVLFVR